MSASHKIVPTKFKIFQSSSKADTSPMILYTCLLIKIDQDDPGQDETDPPRPRCSNILEKMDLRLKMDLNDQYMTKIE